MVVTPPSQCVCYAKEDAQTSDNLKCVKPIYRRKRTFMSLSALQVRRLKLTFIFIINRCVAAFSKNKQIKKAFDCLVYIKK